MNPEVVESIRIADKHLAGQSNDRRKALALDIQKAIILFAASIAGEAIAQGIKETRESH